MSCDYCDEMRGLETVYSSIYGFRDRVAHETKSFVVFPCMGQLREGHLLIASKSHINAIGMLGAGAVGELESLTAETARFFQDTYQKDLLCFEHGVLDDRGTSGGCGIYHMHLHLLPASQAEFSSLLELVRGDGTNHVRPARGLADTREPVSAGETYVFLSLLRQARTRDAFITTNSRNYFESQYMRKMVCRVFGKETWDWRQMDKPEPELIHTLEKSRAFFRRQAGQTRAG